MKTVPKYIWFMNGKWLLRCKMIGYAIGGIEVEVCLTGQRIIGMPLPFGDSKDAIVIKSVLK